MLPRNRLPSHPGKILKDQFLKPRGLSEATLAEHLTVPVQWVNELVDEEQGVTAETAWLLSQAFDTTPDFWLNLQIHHDLAVARPEKSIPPLYTSD